MSKGRCYISGPITGIDGYMEKFMAAERLLERNYRFHSVVNPALVNSMLPKDFTHADYMVVSLAELSTCDTIYMLSGWENSKGATMEFEYAERLGYTIMYEGSEVE